MNALKQFPSHIDQELNLEPPRAIDHVEDSDGDSEDSDSGRYELWTFRIPSDMKVSDLHGVEIDLKAMQTMANNTSSSGNAGGMKINDGKFTIDKGETVENETFRVLVPSSANANADDDESSSSNSNSDSDSDSSEKKKQSNTNPNKFLLHPSSKRFSKHFNVHKNGLSRKTEAELAPSQTKGPEPVRGENDNDQVLRHAYCPIPQRKGLKRRWMLPGNPRVTLDIPQQLVTLKTEQNDDNVTAPTKKQRSRSRSRSGSNDLGSPKRKHKSKHKDRSNNKEKEKAKVKAAPSDDTPASPSKKKRGRSRSRDVGSPTKSKSKSQNKDPPGEKESSNEVASTPKSKGTKAETEQQATPTSSKAEKKAAKKSAKKEKKKRSKSKTPKNEDDAVSV